MRAQEKLLIVWLPINNRPVTEILQIESKAMSWTPCGINTIQMRIELKSWPISLSQRSLNGRGIKCSWIAGVAAATTLPTYLATRSSVRSLGNNPQLCAAVQTIIMRGAEFWILSRTGSLWSWRRATMTKWRMCCRERFKEC